jgi:type IV secretion system protein TrbJ
MSWSESLHARGSSPGDAADHQAAQPSSSAGHFGGVPHCAADPDQLELPLAVPPRATRVPGAGSGGTRRVGDTFRPGPRLGAVLVAVGLAAAATPWRAAGAQLFGPLPVVDVHATGQWVTQLARMSQQIATARDQLTTLRANMTKLGAVGGYHLRTIDAALAEVDALARQGQAIGYSLGNVDAVFRQTFPGGVVPSDYPAERRVQLARTLETLRGALNAASATARQLAAGTGKLAALKGQLQAITSAQQATELNGVIGLHMAEELTLLRQQMAAIANAQAVVMASEVQRDAQAQAAAERLLDRMAAPKPPRPGVRLRLGGTTP